MTLEQGPVSVSREELYEMVWTDPTATVAARFGLSGPGLAKICKRLNVPRPGGGYWAKLRHGRRVRRSPLRPHSGRQVVELGGRAVEEAEERGPVAEQKAHEALPENRIAVPERVRRFDSLVKATREWQTSSNVSKSATHLDVQVEKKSLSRASLIMHALITALEARQYPVRVNIDGGTFVDVQGMEVRIGLSELYERVELPPTPDMLRRAERYEWYKVRPHYERRPTGRLSLQILDWEPTRARKSWRDGKRQRVEACLNAFVVGLVRVAESKKEVVRAREEQRRIWAEEQAHAEDRRRREEAEQLRVTAFRKTVESWCEAQVMREYLNAYRLARRTLGGSELAARDEWLAWAERFVEELDPLNRPTG